ncbi:hypothetical protein J7J90_00030 [Candidatus Micrarchaeota archaeon]|nr:hypothetical protein [Candidatus Micrarchaeota archaeon]
MAKTKKVKKNASGIVVKTGKYTGILVDPLSGKVFKFERVEPKVSSVKEVRNVQITP